MTSLEQLRLADFLGHILSAIERCERYTAEMDEAAFLDDEKTQEAVIRTFEIIDEASNIITRRFPDFAAQHPQVPWRMAIGMRNMLAHGYFTVDLAAIWRTIQDDLPELYREIRALADALRDQQ
jgi:uncharacterized protein with HEPN domain